MVAIPQHHPTHTKNSTPITTLTCPPPCTRQFPSTTHPRMARRHIHRWVSLLCCKDLYLEEIKLNRLVNTSVKSHILMNYFILSNQSYWEQNSPYSTNYNIPPQQQSSVHQSQPSHAPGTILDSIGVPVSTQVSDPCHLQQPSPRGTNVGIVSTAVLSEEIGPLHHQLPPTPGTILDCEGSPLSSEVRRNKSSPLMVGLPLTGRSK